MNQTLLKPRFSFRPISLLLGLLWIGISLLCASMPAIAVNRPSNPQLEEQVLQIIRNHPEVLLESLQTYQQQQQQQLQQAQQAFVQEMIDNPKTIVGDSPTTGAAESKILLVEFSDFQCPYCADVHKTVKQFMAKHQDRVTLAYKHFPLTPIHPEAWPAATAAWAALQQGKFWEYHDALFSHQDRLGEAFYQEIAQSLNLDLEQFNRDRTSANPAIAQDAELAQSLGLSGTPFFIMNGATFSGAVQLSDFEEVFAQVSASQ